MIPKISPLLALPSSVVKFTCVQCPCGGILTVSAVWYDCVETAVASTEDVELVLRAAAAGAVVELQQ